MRVVGKPEVIQLDEKSPCRGSTAVGFILDESLFSPRRTHQPVTWTYPDQSRHIRLLSPPLVRYEL